MRGGRKGEERGIGRSLQNNGKRRRKRRAPVELKMILEDLASRSDA